MFRTSLLFFVLVPILINAQEKYKQRRTLLPNGGLDLFWGVEFDRLYLKLVSKKAKHIMFALSYNDIPTDGIIAGHDAEKNEILRDLHLDFAGNILKIEIVSMYLEENRTLILHPRFSGKHLQPCTWRKRKCQTWQDWVCWRLSQYWSIPRAGQ